MSKNPLTALSGLLLLVLAAGFVSAQSETTSSSEQADNATQDTGYVERVGVVRINMQVFVTDKKGNRVTGLTKDDFVIVEDGRPVEITSFDEVVGGKRTTLADLAAAEQGEIPLENTVELEKFGEPEAAEVPEDERLHLIVYLDNLNLRPNSRVWALEGVKDFIRHNLAPSDLAMVVSYDRSFHIRQQFTTDREAVVGALREAGKLSAVLETRDAERRRVAEDVRRSRDAFTALSQVRQYAEFVEHEMGFAIRAVEEITRLLAGVNGRKALLYISDGVPMVAAEEMFMAVDVKHGVGSGYNQAFRHDMQRYYRRLVQTANANGVTFYTLDARGTAQDQSFSPAERRDRYGEKAIWIEQTAQANLAAPLQMMAESTGGKAIIQTNALGPALSRVSEDFSNYYNVSFKPLSPSDGRYHSIDVRLKDKGRSKGRGKLRVRHRSGYQSKTVRTELIEGTTASLFFGFESNPLGIDVNFGQPRPVEQDRWMLPVRVRIPIGSVLLVPRNRQNLARMEISVGVMDELGQISPVDVQKPFEFNIPDADLEVAMDKYYTYELNLLVRRGRQRVSVALRDSYGDKVSYLRRTINL
ncbi:hypothetical protein ABI59_21290 [Acidobacteria bacterium Mor1]|nr:hypothetical protein ABI59_21290 [Acidobacteria bacterium Mor1]